MTDNDRDIRPPRVVDDAAAARHVERHGAEPVEAAWRAYDQFTLTGGQTPQVRQYLREAVIEAALRAAPEPGLRLDVERLRAWVGENAMRWDKYPSGTTVVDAEALDAFLTALAARTQTEDPDGR